MTLGQFIKSRREALAMSLQDVGDASGVSKAYVWELEQDKSMPSLRVAMRLSITLGVSVNALAATTLEEQNT